LRDFHTIFSEPGWIRRAALCKRNSEQAYSGSNPIYQ
jgi:hypothetical protein